MERTTKALKKGMSNRATWEIPWKQGRNYTPCRCSLRPAEPLPLQGAIFSQVLKQSAFMSISKG